MKIGRLLLIGFEGTVLPEDFKPLIKKYGIGGFVLFERNLKTPEQILALNKELHQIDADDGFTPIIAVDQEGGRVQRLKPPFSHLPSARKVGESYKKHKNISDIYEYGSFIAQELAIAGFNMDLAPVLDLSEKKDGVIGDRAFSDVPLIVEEIGVSMIAGIQDHGIIACAKHFPGSTDTTVDPHKDLPSVNIKSDALVHNITPFIHAIKNDVGSVMVSHTLLKGIDTVPASMSGRIINAMLKMEANFKGIVLTDDVKMGAISKSYSVSQAVIDSLGANADMVMISNTNPDEIESVLYAVRRAIDTGVIKKEQAESSLMRIDIIKNEIGIKNQIVQSVPDIMKTLNDDKRKSILKRF